MKPGEPVSRRVELKFVYNFGQKKAGSYCPALLRWKLTSAKPKCRQAYFGESEV